MTRPQVRRCSNRHPAGRRRRGTPFSLVWPAVRTFALLDPDGRVRRCQPVADSVKVIYRDRAAAEGAARMLRELGQGDSSVYECPRLHGAYRVPHFHLTSRIGDQQ